MSHLRNRLYLFGHPISKSLSPVLHNSLLEALDLNEFNFGLVDIPSIDKEGSPFQELIKQDNFCGASVTMPFKVSAMRYVDRLTNDAKLIGSINTIYYDHLKNELVGTNTDYLGVYNAILFKLLGSDGPFIDTKYYFKKNVGSAFVLGGGGAARAAVFALHKLNLSPIYLVNRDKEESDALVSQFPSIKIISVESIEQAQDIIDSETISPFLAAVGCIPAIPPSTESEARVQTIAQMFLNRKFTSSDKGVLSNDNYILSIPEKPIFLDMAYNPTITPMLKQAEKSSWKPISGLNALLEQAFVADQLWLTGQGCAMHNKSIQSEISKVRQDMLHKYL